MRAAGLYVAVRAVVLGVLLLAAQVADRDVLRVLTGWDAGWYAGIADRGYGTVVQHPDGRLLSDYAFFPLFPVAERVFRVAIGSDFAVAGLVVAVLSSVVAAVGIYRVGELLKGERAGLLLVLLWAVLPVGAVQWMSYSESLFTALAAWSLYFVLTERWVPAGWLCLLAGLTRPTGAALVAAVVVAAALDLRRSPRHPWKRAQAILLAPLGLLGYLLFVASRTHDLFGYFAVTRGWNNGIDFGAAFLDRLGEMLAAPSPWPGLAIVAGVIALVSTGRLGLPRRPPAPAPRLLGGGRGPRVRHVRLLRLEAPLPAAGVPAAAPDRRLARRTTDGVAGGDRGRGGGGRGGVRSRVAARLGTAVAFGRA